MRLGKRCGGGDASIMNPRNWPVYRQLTGTDPKYTIVPQRRRRERRGMN